MDNPTIVSAALSDKELQDSINRMVANFDKGLQDMLEHSNEYVGKIQESLQKIGNTNFGAKGSNDGGVAKQTKAQEEYTESVRKTTSETKRMGKETEMSFDQIAAGLDKARRTVSDFNTKRASGILPSSDDYKRYEQALARIVEYNDKLKQSALSRADANQWANVFDARRSTKDLFSTDDRLKQLNKYYAEQEKLSQKAAQDEERQRQKRVAAMEKESATQKKLVDDQYKLAFARTAKIPTDQLDLAQAKLERLQALLRDMRERGILSNTQIASTEAEIRKLEQMVGQVNAAQQQTTQSAHQYTEEIRKQAQAIRESQQWKEKGYATVGDRVYYDPERSVAPAKNRLSLEEQILNVQKEEEVAAIRAANAQRQEAAEKAALEQESKRVLSVEQQITAEQQKRSQPKTFASYDSLRESIAHVLGMQQSQIKLADTETASYNNLSTTLKQLKQAYDRLTSSERNSNQGKVLVASMHEVERAIQQIQSQASRPTSLKNVMGLNEKTLDDITYKMRQLASYRSGLNVDTQQAEIGKVNAEYDRLKKKMDEVMNKNKDMIASNTALGRSWNYMKNRLAFYFTVGASTQFVKNLIDIRSQYELLERSIGILFDSMQTGTKIFSELNQMAIKSPFTTMELGAAAKQLSAYNIAAKDVVDTTRRLADMAAAVGIPIERLTYALGQIKSYGYLNSRDARMFANAGLPLIQNLADMYTKLEGRLVSIGDVYDRIKKKQVSFEDTLKVVHEMTDEGGRFFNFQEKAADTLKVRLANLTLAWNNMLNDIGKSNQSVLTSGLGILKETFENWRKIDNLIWAIITNLGVAKGVQLLLLLNAKGITKQMAIQEVLGKRLGSMIYGIASSLKALAVNPLTWLTVALTAVTYLGWKFYDLTQENERFNKSIADGTKENISSIDKFFDKYRKDIESVGSLNTTDQQKMWERIREEIEKTTKNAQQYIDILEKIPELDKRIGKASGFLEQEKVIQEELNRLAQHGYFNVGGSFADDSYAETLVAIDKYTGEMIRKYGSYEKYLKAFKDEFQGFYDEFKDTKFSWNLNEEVAESVEHFKKLENLNWGRILSGGTDEEKLARIRDTFMSLRDQFFATGSMQNAGAEAQSIYNRHMDYWITSMAKANGLIKELTVNGKTYSAQDVASVEERRTEWELFFSYLSDEERRTMDYLVKTNQTGGDEFKKIWDTAADSMKESNATAYRDLQKKIAELRETPDIVINVVYRELRDNLDKQQQEFEDRWITPKNWTVRNLTAEEYMKEETANRTKYGRLMRKTEEDNVEWEERLGKEYQENAKKIKSLNAQLNGKRRLEEADRQQKEKDLNLYKDLNAAIKDIANAENFNLDQFKKGNKGSKKDPVLDALKQEISLVEKLQSDYDKLTKSGASQADALATIRGAYGKTIRLLNTQLQSHGLPQINISELITGKDPNKALAHFKQTLDTLVRKGMLTLERSKELEAVVGKFTLSAKTYDLDKITKGLNNELGKLKDEYELAVELDANPELGNMFADMFGINTSTLPQTFGEALDRAQIIVNRKLSEMNISTPFDLMQDNVQKFAESAGFDKESNFVKELTSGQKMFQEMFKKNITETEKMLDDYVKKYGDYSDKIAEIEADRLEKLKKLNEAYYTEEMRKRPEYAAKLNAIEQGAKKEKQQVEFDEFKNSRYYTMMFENLDYISTKTIRDMRDRVRDLIDTMNDLTPEQLKTLITQYEKLEQKLAKRSPFKSLTKDLKKYFKTSKDRKAANLEFKNAQKEYDAQKKSVAALKEKYEQAKANSDTSKSYLDFLQIEIDGENEVLRILKEQLDAAEEKASKYNLIKKLALEEASATAKMVATNLQSLSELRDQFNELFGVDASKGETLFGHNIDGIIDGLASVGQSISKIVSSAENGDVFGVVGGVVGVFEGIGDSVASIFGDGSARTKRINKEINKSVEVVRKLSMAYKELERAVETGMGAQELQARREEINNKKLQLQELQRQMELEKSKRSKDRDDDKIKQYEEEIQDLQFEIQDLADDIAATLLGGKVKDAAEDFVNTWVDAWRAGEDTMDALSGKFDDMIDNMIMKSIASKVVANHLQKIWDAVDQVTAEGGEGGSSVTMNELQRIKSLIGDKSISESIDEDLKALYGVLGIAYGSGKEKQLSALQQGISGITEDQAGALEAYWNINTQQQFVHTELLTQIRDIINGFDMDVQVGVLSQMLLQLQTNYQCMMAMQSMMEGWTNPAGNGIRVELIS